MEELKNEHSSGVADYRSCIVRVVRESVELEERRSWFNTGRRELECSSTMWYGNSSQFFAEVGGEEQWGDEATRRHSLFFTDVVLESVWAKFVFQFCASADFTSCSESRG